MAKTLLIRIHGKVQGVGFRFCSYEKFVELGLTGKVENERDGSVRAEVTGEETSIEQFIQWAKIGPSGAKVESVEVGDVPGEEK